MPQMSITLSASEDSALAEGCIYPEPGKEMKVVSTPKVHGKTSLILACSGIYP
jgi:hypothetical protein